VTGGPRWLALQAYGVVAGKHKSQLRGRKRLEMFKPLQLIDLGQMRRGAVPTWHRRPTNNAPQTKSKKKAVRINLLEGGIYTELWGVF
jgi:hypothetical protein